jgi:hypothetical protein
MSDSIALWHAEHANFATLLDLLEGQLDLFHKGEKPDYELMLHQWRPTGFITKSVDWDCWVTFPPAAYQ